MSRRSVKIFGRLVFLGAFLGVMIAFGAAGYAADNAVITGDGVRMREVPSVTGNVVGVLSKGTRVEVVTRMNFEETIGGDTAPWYEVRYRGRAGYVFGRFVKPDAGVNVSVDMMAEGYNDPVYRLVEHGKHLFGKNEAEITARLGKPASVSERTGEYVDTLYRDVSYGGVGASFYRYPEGNTALFEIRITTDRYAVDGLKVGGRLSDIERLLGMDYSEAKDKFTWYDKTGYMQASFKLKNGKIVEMIFFSDYYD